MASKKVRTTLSGIHPNIVQHGVAKRAISIIVRNCDKECEAFSGYIVFPGCDFEIIVQAEIPVAFRRKDIYCRSSAYPENSYDIYLEQLCNTPAVEDAEFNKLLMDNMMLALRKVAGTENVVAESRHFVSIYAKAIEDLEKLEKRMSADNPDLDKIAKSIQDIRLKLFSTLMSRDIRKNG